MTKTKRIILTVLALAGLALSAELCIVYYNANFVQNAAPSICAVNDMMDCDGVAKTAYSQFLGVPLSLWGIILYLFFLFMIFVDKVQNLKFLGFLKVFKNPPSYIFCIASLSFILSMILAGISILKINSICIFCFTTYFIDLLIAVISKTKGNSIPSEIKISVNDFIEAVKVKRYAVPFAVLLLSVSAVLYYTYMSDILAPQMLIKKEYRNTFKNYEENARANKLGKEDADIIIHEFMDFNCPGCFMTQLYLHRIINEFENVMVIQHNLPLDKECNHNMQSEGHKNSCLKTRYALAAAKQNKYWQMADILFEQNPETEKEIIEEARLFDFDIKKLKEDAASEEVKKEIEDSVKLADSHQIGGTPTFLIGVKKFMGSAPYPDFKKFITDNGGIEKENHD